MMSMVLIVFLLFGVLAYFTLNLELIPDIQLPAVTIQTVYKGAGPKDIETQITKPVEDAIASISKIDRIQSYSMEGVSLVIVMFDLDKDEDVANQEVKDKVDAILNDLPEAADLPTVTKLNPLDIPVVEVVLAGQMDPIKLWDFADKRLKDRLSQLPGVASVTVTGGQEREIRVELDDRTMQRNGLTLTQLDNIITAQNLDIPAGYMQRRSQEYSVRFKGEFQSVDAIGELEVPTPYGARKLSDLARVVDTGADVRQRSTYFNKPEGIDDDNVVLLSLWKADDGNTVVIAEGVKEALPEIQKLLPAGCSLSLATDNSLFIRASVKDTLTNVILGVILTALVLLLFLHDIRSTIIVALSMPMSILSTFLLLQMSGYTLNLMSLMGLSTAVGILVANSVVVIENIFRHRQMGKDRATAAAHGTGEIVGAVLASTLTNVVVFLPIANMTSIAGSMMVQFAMTVVYATGFSLLMSFTLTPMLASLILSEKQGTGSKFARMFEGWMSYWEQKYRQLLAWLLATNRRAWAVVIISVLCLVGSLPMASRIGFDFVPTFDEGNINVELELPLGYRLDESAALAREVESRLHEDPQVVRTTTTLGKISDQDVGTNLSLVQVKLTNAADRKETTNQVVARFIKHLSDIPNAHIRVKAISSIGTGRDAIELNLLGQDLDTLEVYKAQLEAKFKTVPGLINLNTSSRSGKPEIALEPDRRKLADAGLTVHDLSSALRGAVDGVVSTRYRDQGEEYDIRVVCTDISTDTPEKLANLTVVGPGGIYRMSQLANVTFTEGYSKINHKDRYKAITFTGGVAPGYVLGDIANEMNARIAEVTLPVGYKTDWGGNAKYMNETIADMGRTFIIALALTYMLLSAMLESLKQSLIILATVPLAFVGVFGGLYIAGLSMNMISMLAIVMLLGIVVNNAILQLDHTNILVREQKRDITSALLEACPLKLRPILMSTLAIIIGMVPMAMGLGEAGREMRQPMGVVSIGGLIASTALSLIVIPVVTNMVSRKKTPATEGK